LALLPVPGVIYSRFGIDRALDMAPRPKRPNFMGTNNSSADRGFGQKPNSHQVLKTCDLELAIGGWLSLIRRFAFPPIR
jgi:hypothetical protein